MVNKIFAYAGKILRIDLNTGKVSLELTENYCRDWLGGTGVAQWILYNELKPWVTPYDPANRLIFGTGPLNGTLAPTASRLSADTKNPITNGVGSSNAAGFFAGELKFAGYDHLVIKGKANIPVYLWINDDKVEIRNALGLWGKTTWETEDMIKAELKEPKVQVLCIGPAGERLVKSACAIINKNRAFGRSGIGAVMGSKNLKAIAVKGSGEIRVAKPQEFFSVIDKISQSYNQSKILTNLKRFGTIASIKRKNQNGALPYKNFQELQMPEDIIENFNPDSIVNKYRQRKSACLACPIACSPIYWLNSGPYAGLWTVGAQTEALVCFSGKLAVSEPSFHIKANSLCNQLGPDSTHASYLRKVTSRLTQDVVIGSVTVYHQVT
jgi:aldehyde:ferredoxin oxidoreductase